MTFNSIEDEESNLYYLCELCSLQYFDTFDDNQIFLQLPPHSAIKITFNYFPNTFTGIYANKTI